MPTAESEERHSSIKGDAEYRRIRERLARLCGGGRAADNRDSNDDCR